MSGSDYLNSLSENASRLGMRLQETFSEHTRELGINRGSGSQYFDTADEKTSKNIRTQLDSSSDREKMDAMKRLIALISKGRNVSEYFAQVVKNVASHNLEIRKLVYIYLLRYAEQEPDLALLSINTFQKDLSDSNPLIRAMALRVLSGIKVPMIGNIIVLAIKKCAADISPYVRKVAALAIPKCYNLDNGHLPSLIEIIISLLRDRSPLSVGSVVVAFEAVCRTRLDLIHQHYRRLCRILVDVDEWGQVNLVELLVRYARTMLPRPSHRLGEDSEVDQDVLLLLSSTEPLFQSRNPAVVLAAARTIYYIGPPSYHKKFVQPLLRLLHASREVERVVLSYILIICGGHPSLFSPSYTRFLLRSDDVRQTKADKLRVLLSVVNVDTHQAILRELIDYSDDPDDAIVAQAIQGIGRVAYVVPDCTQQCLTALISMIKSTHDPIVGSAVQVLKYLVQTQLSGTTSNPSPSPITIISHLARKLDDIRHPHARACVVWLVGQYSASDSPGLGRPDGVTAWAPDVLRKSVKGFTDELPLVKLQIITLAAKLVVLSSAEPRLALLAQYVFSLARYDLNYDVRDRARMLSSLLSGIFPDSFETYETSKERGGVILRKEQIKLVLFEGKTSIVNPEPSHTSAGPALIGSLDLITGNPMHGDRTLPDWLEKGVESSLRTTEEDLRPPPAPVPTSLSSSQFKGKGIPTPVVLTPAGSSSPAGSFGPEKGKWTDLDKFYEDDDDEEEEEEEEEAEDDAGEGEDDDREEGEVEDEESSDEESGEGREPPATNGAKSGTSKPTADHPEA